MEKYENIKYGITKGFFQAENCSSSETVTLKQLGFPNEEGVPVSLIQEITFLKQIEHDHIIKLIDVATYDDKISIVLVYEFMDTNLTSFMQKYPKVVKIRGTTKELLRQILLAVSYFHSYGIVHGGIKPKNMFVNHETSTLKITDFIWPRTILNSEDLNEESRFNYKAPEILMDRKQLTNAIDLWSVGCVFAELVNGQPLFTGKNEVQQLGKIFSIMGKPTEETWPGISSIYGYLHVYTHSKPKDLSQLVPGLEAAGMDLLKKLLCMDPKRRITANKALEHEYFRN